MQLISCQYLAADDAKILCILGSGAQARSHVEALKCVRSFTEVRFRNKTDYHF